MFGNNFDFDGFARLVELLFSRAASHSQWWIALWLAGVLVATAIAMICRAPQIAYVVLLTVVLMAVLSDGRSGRNL